MKQLALLLIISSACIAQTYKTIEPPTDERVCTEEEKAGNCTNVKGPVCGFYNDEKGIQQQKTFEDRCTACKDKNVLYVYKTKCQNFPAKARFCIPRPGFHVYCENSVKPVVAFLNKNADCKKGQCKAFVQNDCYACYYTNNVDYYRSNLINRQL